MILRRINLARRALMRQITGKIGKTSDMLPQLSQPPVIKTILICRPNHRLGNMLLITPLVQEVVHTFPDAKIDLMVKGNLATVIFKHFTNITRIIQLPKKPFKDIVNYARVWIKLRNNNYDLVINTVYHSSSGRLLTKLAKGKYKIFGDLDFINSSGDDAEQHVAMHPVLGFRGAMRRLGFTINEGPVPPMDLKLTGDEISTGKRILGKYVDTTRRTISLFTFATGEKCYSDTWWDAFYSRLLLEFPDYNLLEILPVENISMLGFKAPSFYSRDIREIASVMRNTSIFIGADSGMMHLASASRIPTIGLFKVTSMKTFAPYGNESLAINTTETKIDDWIGFIKAILR